MQSIRLRLTGNIGLPTHSSVYIVCSAYPNTPRPAMSHKLKTIEPFPVGRDNCVDILCSCPSVSSQEKPTYQLAECANSLFCAVVSQNSDDDPLVHALRLARPMQRCLPCVILKRGICTSVTQQAQYLDSAPFKLLW